MKILRTLTLSLVLITSSFALKAATPGTDGKLTTVKDVVNTYVGAMTHGYIKNFDLIVDQNAKFMMLRGKNMLSFTKAEMLSVLAENQYFDQGCTVNKSVTNNSDDLVVAKVDMVYDEFTRSNYVTIVNTPNGWKITEVYSVFK
jgi:hypothetical protein